jgi:hypothetical protein
MFLRWFSAIAYHFREKVACQIAPVVFSLKGLEEIKVLKISGTSYEVLFAPQCGQKIAVCGKRVPQYLQGITTTSRITSRTSLSSRLEPEPHPHPKPKGPIC